jgi:hypothetical protein
MNPHVNNIGVQFATKRQIPPAVYTPGTTNGTGFSKKTIGNPQSCKIVANSGAVVGSAADVKLQHSADNSAWADYVPPRGVAADGALPTINAANTLQEKNVDLSSSNEFLRLVSVVSGGTSIAIEAHITVGGGDTIPQT